MAKTVEEDKAVLEQLLDDWDEDSKIDKSAPNESAATISCLHAKYLRILAKNTLNIQEANKEYKKMRAIRGTYYGGGFSKEALEKIGWEQYLGPSPKTTAGREEMLNHDSFLIEIVSRREIYELIVQCCEKIIKEINSRHYTVGAFMNWEMKIRNG